MGFGGSGGGSGSVGGSSDVALNNPVDNNVLTYDASLTKWKNAVAPAAIVSSVAGKTGAVTLAVGDVTNLSASLATKVDSSALSTTWGVLPTLYWTGTTWPSRTVPSGYSGPVVWDSADDAAASTPSASLTGDRWLRRTS